MKDSEKVAGLLILLFAGIPGMIAISAILNGFVLTKLWAWFIVPQFGLVALRIPFAIGISLVVGFLTHQTDTNKEENKSSFGTQFGLMILRPFMMLFTGWIVQMFI